jgi:hypothetical protein
VKKTRQRKPDNSSPVTYYTAAIPFFNKESSMPHLHSVIPPYILRRIIESGSEPQQRCAVRP